MSISPNIKLTSTPQEVALLTLDSAPMLLIQLLLKRPLKGAAPEVMAGNDIQSSWILITHVFCSRMQCIGAHQTNGATEFHHHQSWEVKNCVTCLIETLCNRDLKVSLCDRNDDAAHPLSDPANLARKPVAVISLGCYYSCTFMS